MNVYPCGFVVHPEVPPFGLVVVKCHVMEVCHIRFTGGKPQLELGLQSTQAPIWKKGKARRRNVVVAKGNPIGDTKKLRGII